MPKPVKIARRPPSDPNRAGADMVSRSLEVHETPSPPPDFKAQLGVYMSEMGRKGGKASGAKRMEMPVEERRRIASLAARAMWAKRKGATKKR